ncbi:MAG: hypothetical protein BRD48_03365 [Bacteroidetes bacterium QS_9_68_14]|nr:MAG: hypothetical protein BRD48_03365 [Bacteroidetes bacterium QS_9_68_14]
MIQFFFRNLGGKLLGVGYLAGSHFTKNLAYDFPYFLMIDLGILFLVVFYHLFQYARFFIDVNRRAFRISRCPSSQMPRLIKVLATFEVVTGHVNGHGPFRALSVLALPSTLQPDAMSPLSLAAGAT